MKYLSVCSCLAILAGMQPLAAATSTHEIARLKAEVAELMKRIDALDQKPHLKEPAVVTHANNLKVRVSGQINRAAWLASNGENSNLQVVDNDNAPSLLNITAEKDLNCDVTVGGIFEVELLQNSTRTTDIKNSSTSNKPFTARKSEVFGRSKTFGELCLGKGKMASYNTMDETDLSGTKLTGDGAFINLVAGAVTFFDSTTNSKSVLASGTTEALTVADVFDSANGLYFKDRIRYNSPAYMGLAIQSSYAYHSSNDMWDVALKYDAKWLETQVATQIAYVEHHVVPLVNSSGQTISNTGYRQVNGSAGLLFPEGFSVMFAAAHREWDYPKAPDAHHWFCKLGYQRQVFDAGKTAVSIDYGQFHNFVINTSTPLTVAYRHIGKTVGAGLVQFLDRIATELYLGGRLFSLHVRGGDHFKDIKTLMAGARVTF